MELTHIAKIQLPGLSKLAIQIHILPKTQIAPLISLGVLCDDEFTITLDKKAMSIQKIEKKYSKGPETRRQ